MIERYVLAECDWRFSVVEVDNSIYLNNSPKLKPQIGATRELLLFMIASLGPTNQRLGFWGVFGDNGIAVTLYHTKPPNTSYFS